MVRSDITVPANKMLIVITIVAMAPTLNTHQLKAVIIIYRSVIIITILKAIPWLIKALRNTH